MSTITIALDLVGRDLTGGIFSGAAADIARLAESAALGGKKVAANKKLMLEYTGSILGAGAAFAVFTEGTKLATEAGAQLEMATTMAAIAISDGKDHVKELEAAIVDLANNSQYKIADVDLAFRMLGERGFNTAQILQGGLGQAAINLGQAMGDTAVNGADVLSQALRLMTNDHLTASSAADELTRAFYDGMPAASDLTTFLGMAGGSANTLHMSLKDLLVAGDMLTPVMGSASSAGASLNYMLNQLVAPTGPAASAIKKLGLQVFDAKGHFVGFKDVMDQLIVKMKDMPDSERMPLIRELFSTRSGRGAQDLIGMLDQFDVRYKKIGDDIGQVGTAQKDAAAINDTAQGSWNRLTTTFNDFFARSGTGINEVLKPLYNDLNNLLSVAQQNPLITKFFAAFLVGGTILAGVTLAALALGAAIGFGLMPLILPLVATFAAIVAVAGVVAGLFVVLTTHTQLFHGQLAFLNPVIDGVRAAFGFLGNVWQTQILPALKEGEPVWKALGIAMLAIAAIGVGVVVVAILAVAGAITGIFLVISNLVDWFKRAWTAAGEFGHVLSDIFIALHDALTGQWGRLAGDMKAIQSDMAGAMTRATEDMYTNMDAKQRAAAERTKLTELQKDNDLKEQQKKAISDKLTAAEQDYAKLQAAADKATDTETKHNLQAQADEKARLVNSLSDQYQTLQKHIDDTNKQMGQLRTDISNNMDAMLQDVTSKFSKSAQEASIWGQNLDMMYASGLRAGTGVVTDAAGNVIGAVRANMAFHSPTEEGPGSDADTWAPNLIKMYASGLYEGVGTVRSASGAVAGAVRSGILGGQPASSGALRASSGSGQTIVIPVYVGSRQVAEAVFDTLKGTLQQNGMSRSFR